MTSPEDEAPEPAPLSEETLTRLSRWRRAFDQRGHWLPTQSATGLEDAPDDLLDEDDLAFITATRAETCAGMADDALLASLEAMSAPITRPDWAFEEGLFELKQQVAQDRLTPPVSQWVRVQERSYWLGQLAPYRWTRLRALGPKVEEAMKDSMRLATLARRGRAARLPPPPPKPKPAKRLPTRDPAAMTREELLEARVPERVIDAWIAAGRLLTTAEREVYLRTRGLSDEIASYRSK